MTVRAKFKVQKIEASLSMRETGEKNEHNRPVYAHAEMRTIKLSPVYSDVPGSENKAFWAASPSGSIELGTINQQAWEAFELGGEYYVTFEKAGT